MKKLIAAALALTVVLGLTACAKEGDNDAPPLYGTFHVAAMAEAGAMPTASIRQSPRMYFFIVSVKLILVASLHSSSSLSMYLSVSSDDSPVSRKRSFQSPIGQ